MKSQLLSTVAVALLLTAGSAYAQTNKAEQHQAPQASTQDQSGKLGAAQHRQSAQEKRMPERSTTGQASKPEQNAKTGAQQHEMKGRELKGQAARSQQPQPQNAQRQNAAKQPSATEKRSTTGQATPSSSSAKTPSDMKPNTQPSKASTAPSSKQTAQPRSTSGQAPSAQGNSQMQQARGVKLDQQQQTRVADAVFSSHDVQRLDNVDFSINVGTIVPRRVHLVPVPETLVEIYPQWRNDEVVVVRDEIIIVDHSRKIVAVIPAGRHRASVGSSSTTVVNLPRTEIREIQTVLIRKGFLHGRADGVWGPETREALVTFQRREGLQVTGQIDSRTVSSLGLSNKIDVGGAQGQPNAGRAATTGSSSMNRPSNTVPSRAPRETSGQGSRSMNEMPKAAPSTHQGANSNKPLQPQDKMQPEKKSTTGQGSPSMHRQDRNLNKRENELK